MKKGVCGKPPFELARFSVSAKGSSPYRACHARLYCSHVDCNLAKRFSHLYMYFNLSTHMHLLNPQFFFIKNNNK